MARGGRKGRPRVLIGPTEDETTPPVSQVTEHSIDGNISKDSASSPQHSNGIVPETMVDPNEGTALDYIPAIDIQGSKCAKLVESDVANEINYWQNAVLCYVLGANPPIGVIDGFVKRNWKGLEIDKVLLIKKGLYLVCFNELKDAMEVAQKGSFHFDQKPFIVKAWNPDLEMSSDTITTLPIWIQLHDLDLKYWGMQSLSKLGTIVGIPLKTDQYTKERTMLKYARMLVEIPLERDFPEFIEFANEKDVIIRQKVEWRAIATQGEAQDQQNLTAEHMQQDDEGFQLVSRHTARPPSNNNGLVSNSQAQGLSDHTPVTLSFPHLPKPRSTFIFCDMWAKDPEFSGIVRSKMPLSQRGFHLKQLQQMLDKLGYPLKQLNNRKYADIYTQQTKAKAHLIRIQSLLHDDPHNIDLNQQESQARDFYIQINHSAPSLMQQQSKDSNGHRVEGFKAVAEVMTDFYKDLLGRTEFQRTNVDPRVQIHVDGMENFTKSVTNLKLPRKMRSLLYAGINAVIYSIWHARNSRVFRRNVYTSQDALKEHQKTNLT
ncbi:hypothetical protein Cgig2_010652 [Carnegiea gigantea]|uniref:DUF4283 domain-containing protein n=1 Tax=Carnegiea gigantea TaxID=171969 RepID=A0A9Q1GQT5_9CARY|nr:hypothetical protein Cgig2_010652 [Carnegiea gigantea]